MAKAAQMNSNQNEQTGWIMGDPYYCTECERNHIKGKIYKNHLKYAKDIDPENGEEKKKEKDDADQDESEENQDKEDKIDPVERVKNLRGVGKATLRKLKKAGFTSLESIACTPPQIIKEESGIGEKTTEKLIKRSMKKLNMGFKSAAEEWNRRKDIDRITTGAQELDDLLGGGIETGSLIEFFGEYRTGKTQIAHQLCVNVQLPTELGGLGGNALYIDTEGTFRPERIIQMAEAKDMDSDQVLQNIVFGRAYNSDHQVLLIKESTNIISEKNIKLIIIDSLIGHFRSEYVGRGTLASRQQSINQHLHTLLRLCDIHNDLSIVFTNQVSAKPDVFYGNPLTATGGNVLAHASTIRVYLRKGKGQQRVAKIIDAPHLPEGEAIFSITEEGITE
ncbi:MAG: DNA repair and recombination protein RadA [Promethearchaeia archaeon]